MDPVALLHDRGAKDACACALHDAAYRDNGNDQGDKGKVRDVEVSGFPLGAALPLVPSLPVLPCRIVLGVMGPLTLVGGPRVLRGVGGRLVMPCPTEPPRVVCLALGVVREEGMGGDEKTIALQTDVVRQMCYGR